MPRVRRKIPFNYTSADDRQVIVHLLGEQVYKTLSRLEAGKITGRSSRLLHRFLGDMFILQRNPFLFQELVTHKSQRKNLRQMFSHDLATIRNNTTNTDVIDIVQRCESFLEQLFSQVSSAAVMHGRIIKAMTPLVGRDNVYVDAFTLTAHCTDATDWRLFPPFVVLRPSKAFQVPLIMKAVRSLGLHIVPRGAGTGLTGGAVPLSPTCVMVNTEKLNRMSAVDHRVDVTGRSYACIYAEAGVITQDVIKAADRQGFIFATDPTSSWACTIGGNISENAGGKTAVLYGTAIDNILSYDMVMPDGQMLHIARKNHPLRKILPDDTVEFEVFDEFQKHLKTIEIHGSDIRKTGLGKDVTNKTLNGLPGIQKEGCDGILTGATFILYPRFSEKKTFCIEFFGDDMSEASQVITLLVKKFSGQDPALIALEHFDEEYIKAIDYKTKTSVGDRLKAVLLVDMVSDDPSRIETGAAALSSILEPFEKTGMAVARDDKAAERFWQDRKRLGAIAAHTNAFKLNEDIVLPIEALPEFTRYIDQYNIREKKYIQVRIIEDIIKYLDTAIPADDPQWLDIKVSQARDMAFNFLEKLKIASRDALEAWIHPKTFLKQLLESLRGYKVVSGQVTRIFEQTGSRLIVIATHMHAGDGNVHVNIPVLSNDREMMARAAQTADDIMAKAVELDGVVSGEHGIGITKVKHLDPEFLNLFSEYRSTVDPDGIMNPEKLADPQVLSRVFTPSFNLLKLEAGILKHAALEELASSIAGCVRCGRCKPECPVFFPARNMFFHPRNKNLAVGALIEALLYIVQRTQANGFRTLKNLAQIADHCTICHKCFLKCPVRIDSGMITITERNILAERKYTRTSVPTTLALDYLSSRNPLINTLYRSIMFKPGIKLQQAGQKLAGGRFPAGILKTPLTRLSDSHLWAILPDVTHNQAILIEPDSPAACTVFYFPGCGSERLFADISMACLYALLFHGVRVVMPPPFLCCGYPFQVNAKIKKHREIVLRNTIVFSQIRDMFSDLTFDVCLVSCGTCMEALTQFGAGNIFDTSISDVFAFLDTEFSIKGLKEDCYYHTPCHDSLEGTGEKRLGNAGCSNITSIPHCCSEAGTLAMSRPDIAGSLLDRKSSAIRSHMPFSADSPVVLTNCPSCIQGLGRHPGTGIIPRHILVQWAVQTAENTWKNELRKLVTRCQVVNF